MPTKKVHTWMPRYPQMVCRECGVDAETVAVFTLMIACPLCDAGVGEPCVTVPRDSKSDPNQSPPHAVRQRVAFGKDLVEPCSGGTP